MTCASILRAGSRTAAALFLGVVVALLAPWKDAEAQGDQRVIEGRVSRAVAAPGGRTVPVVGAWVVLHRVGGDAAAPLDSMRTRAGGAYAFRYRATGDTAAVYFVSTTRGGIAYFTPPTRDATLRDGDADLMVFDTTSASAALTVRARHLIVTAPDSVAGRVRTVIEVFELSNDSMTTFVPGAEGRHTFRAALPAGVREVTGGQGDVSPEAIRVVDGEVRIFAPFAPGLKQVSFFYELPVASTTMRFPFEGTAPVMEVLVEDPRGTAIGGGLVEVSPVMVEGRPFKRFLAQDVVGPHVLEITAPGPVGSVRAIRVMLIVTGIAATMLLAIGAMVMRRGPAAFRRTPKNDPDDLALEIAALDLAFDALPAPTEEQRAEHYLKRAQLKGRLSATLAKRDGLT